MDKLWRRVSGLLATGARGQSSEPANKLPKKPEKLDSQLQVAQDECGRERRLYPNSFANNQTCPPLGRLGDKNDLVEEEDEEMEDDEDENEAQRRKQPEAPSQASTTDLSQVPAAQPAPTSSFYDCLTPMTRSRLNTLAQIGEDWLYLALLGIIMALLSLFMDSMITMFLGTRIWLSEEMSEQNLLLEYLAWCLVPILLVTFSTGFVHLCSPTAIGSGIPEMKTILRGVVLNEYLTFRTLIAKIVGLTFTLGSGLPLGKEGPSVHMASIVATLLSKLVASFQGIYENESRTSEMLSAACAVGVAATFYAPIGGVLFSIEVTTVYFAIRNYWRGFFAACCGATIWRLLGFYIQNDESISAIFKTNFSTDYPFDPVELLLFSFIGATCGLAAAAYIKFHREIVQFFRRHKRISGFLQQNRFVYPTLVTLIITTSTFPPLLGQYTAATLSTHTTIEHLFSNRTWSLGSQDLVSKRILDSWTTESTSFHVHLILYILMLFWTSALASTIPTPSGVFIPVVKMGAAYGRLIGELMAAAYPTGIKYSHSAMIVPGSYAVVGAAAFSGAVTHTVSTSVILFEMTGQIVHIIPVILGVLISNAVCQSLQPSIYDSIIEIKKLPYLPPIASSNSISHRILVKDFMNTKNIPYVWKERCTYADLKRLLSTHRKIISFPLVESPETMKLLGSVARPDLLKLLYLHLGRERRLQEVCRRNSDTLTPAIHMLSTISGRPLTNSLAQHAISIQPAVANNNNNNPVRPTMHKASDQKDWPVVSSTDEANQQAKKVSVDSSSSEDKGIEFKAKLQQQQQHHAEMQHISMPILERQSSSTSDSAMVIDDGQINYRPNGSMSPDDDCDPTKLIIEASKNCHKYGATVSTREAIKNDKQQQQAEPSTNDRTVTIANPTNTATSARQQKAPLASTNSDPIKSKKPRSGEEQLLSECQKRENAYEEALKEFGSVAKFINHYDRGSSMDKEHLERSIQEVEGHMARVNKTPPEIVVVVESVSGGRDGSGNSKPKARNKLVASVRPHEPNRHQPDGSQSNKKPVFLQPPTETPGKLQARARFHQKQRPSGGGSRQPQRQPPSPAIERRPSPLPSPNLYSHHQPLSKSVSSSPSLSSRPTKSILKTSSCNSMNKRPVVSSHSFSNNTSHHQNIAGQQQSSNNLTQTLTSYNQTLEGRQDNSTNESATRGNSVAVAPPSGNLSNLKFTLAPDLQQHKRSPGYDVEAGLDGLRLHQEQQIRQRRKVRLPRLRVVDMTPEEQEQWENEQLSAYIDLNKCQIDEAPFQLVEQTSLYRVHTLFSMLGLNHAYVTSFGRLVGIVALKDIRYAIEKMLQEKV